MEINDMIMVSVDDHIIEPADLFTRNVAEKFRDRAPFVKTYANGEERWIFDGKRMPTFAPSALAGRDRKELGAEATRFDQIRKGCYDVDARIDDMNVNGTLASVGFATLPGFSGELFLKGEDKELMLALVQAYNNWHMDEWCGKYPGRFIPNAFVPLWDQQRAVEEIRRCADKGAKAINLPENPSAFGLPSIHRDYWYPIFKACVDNDLVVNIHIGTGGGMTPPSADSPVDWVNTMVNIQVSSSLVDLSLSPVIRKLPDIRIAMSEGCIGWVPFIMERADAAYELHRFWTKQDFGDLKPSDIMKRNFLFCFHHDDVGLKYRHDTGIERISWEMDYPHADTTWPHSPEHVWRIMKDMPRDEVDLITHGNALRFYNFDPFVHIPREQATVGALRAQATHVDTSLKTMGGGRQPELDPELKVLTMGALATLQKEMDQDLDDDQQYDNAAIEVRIREATND